MPQLANVAEKEAFYTDLEKLNGRALPGWAREVRQAGVDRFGALEFPHRRMEDWRHTNVSALVSTPFESVVEPGPAPAAEALADVLYHDEDWTELVIVDGFYSSELSRIGTLTHGVRAGSLAEALAEEHPAAKQHLGRYLGEKDSIFAALNTAFLQDGVFVHVPARAVLEAPIHLVFVSTAPKENTATHPRALVVVEPEAEVTFIETYVRLPGASEKAFTNAAVELVVSEAAQVRRYKTLEEPGGYHMSTLRVWQGRASAFTSYSISHGTRLGRNEVKVTLDGEGADTALNGLYMVDGDQLIDNYTSIEHVKPHCTSWIDYKGILTDRGSGVFVGRIFVDRAAQKTDSKQLNNNLLLTDTATVNTRPVLEIYADDVKCTHGATVGLPPEEIIFYFRSRGMSEAMARGMLTYGFAGEIVKAVTVPPLRDRLDRHVFHRYSPRG